MRQKDHKQFIHKLWDGAKVFLVDGDWVRDNMNDEFIGGGHGFQDDYIPEDEIWSELVKDPVDNKEILIHEIIEYIFMKYFHKKYDDSHEIANSVEDTIRRLPDKPGAPMPLTLYEERKEEGGNDDEPGNSMNTGIETSDKVSEYLARGRIKVSFVKHCPGHKDSKGNKAEYCILSHTTDKILSSHKTRSEAEKHLQQMHIHKGETVMEFKDVKSIDDLIVKKAKKNFVYYLGKMYGVLHKLGDLISDPILEFQDDTGMKHPAGKLLLEADTLLRKAIDLISAEAYTLHGGEGTEKEEDETINPKEFI